MEIVELLFPILGDCLPVSHGYALYAGLARRIPNLHTPEAPVAIGPIWGDYVGRDTLRLNRQSRLRFRLPIEWIIKLLPLAGQALDVAGRKLRVGVPQIRALVPSPILTARIVTMKIHEVPNPEPDQFLEAVRRRLTEHGITGEPSLPLVRTGSHARDPCRRILRLKDRAVVGFALRLSGLSSMDSLRLQADSPFGRRRMGCGFFVPTREENQ